MSEYKLTYQTDFIEEVTKQAGSQKFVLASNSPRRFEILKMLGIDFKKVSPDVDENISSNGNPYDYSDRLAVRKAKSLEPPYSSIIIGSDTIVVLGKEIINKPRDKGHAHEILSMLAGKTHSVITSVALKDSESGRLIYGHDESRVRFREYDKDLIEDYIDSGEPFGKAGAYAIQGKGGELVESYQGNLDTIIGFPAGLFLKLWKNLKSEV